eukprot:s1486_g1.t1
MLRVTMTTDACVERYTYFLHAIRTSFADDLRVALGSRADVRRIVQQQTQGTFGRIDEDSIGGRSSGAGGSGEPHFEFKLREFWHRAVDEEPLAEGPSGPSGGRKHSSSAQMFFPDSSKAIIGGSARESVLPFIQHPGSPLRAWWDVLGMTLLTFDIVVIPLRFFDPPETLVLVIMSWVTQLFWNLDILVSFITGYYHKGIVVLDLRRIAKHYATTWFPFDATVVGIDWLLYGLEGRNQTAGVARLSKTVRILRFLRLVRLARLAKVSTMVEALQEQVNSQVATIHYMKIIGRMMLLNHVIACSWWGIAQLDEGQPNWITENQLEGRSIEYQYSTALHWSLTQLGVGQTNIEAVNFAERLFSIFITFCALITFSTLVSSVTSLMASLQRLKTEEIEQFRSLRRFLVQNEIPADLGHRVTRFLQYTYALRHEALSLDSRRQLENSRGECAFFDRLLQHDSFHVVRVLREVATGCLSHAVLAAGDVAFAAGAVASSAYFLAGGAFCYSREGVRSSVPCQKWVAEMCLWTPWLHVGDLVSEEVSRVIALEVTNFCECVGKVLESKMLGAAYAEDGFSPEEYVANLNSQLQWSDVWFYDADRAEHAATAVSTRPVPRPRCCGTSRRRKNRVNPIVHRAVLPSTGEAYAVKVHPVPALRICIEAEEAANVKETPAYRTMEQEVNVLRAMLPGRMWRVFRSHSRVDGQALQAWPTKREIVEPSVLVCPITQTMYHDPVFVPESGNTYERHALEQYWETCVPPRDPLTNTVLQQRTVYTNWGIRREAMRGREMGTCLCVLTVVGSLAVVMHQVYEESFWPRLSIAEDLADQGPYLKVPKGSRLEAREVNGRLIVKIPPPGLRLDILGQVLFSILWLSFVCYWTIAAVSSGVPWTFIPFSLPFWAVGFMLLFSTILTPSLSQTLIAGSADYQVTSQVSRLSLSQVTANVTDLQENPGVLCISDADCRLVLQDGVQEVRWIQKQLCRHWGVESTRCLERSVLNSDLEAACINCQQIVQVLGVEVITVGNQPARLNVVTALAASVLYYSNLVEALKSCKVLL